MTGETHYFSHGTSESRSVHDALVAALASDGSDEPAVLLLEPVNGKERLHRFQGLTLSDRWNSDATVDLAEARVGFEGGLLHLLAQGTDVRWAAFWCGGGAPPAWVPEGAPVEEESSESESYPVLLPNSVAARLKEPRAGGAVDRGLRVPDVGDVELEIEEYRSRGRLRWWTLRVKRTEESPK